MEFKIQIVSIKSDHGEFILHKYTSNENFERNRLAFPFLVNVFDLTLEIEVSHIQHI